jgi:vancomycin resistance protein VanJ
MARSSQSQPASFWRCGKCNTPNPWKSYLTNCIGCGAPRPAAPEGFKSRHAAPAPDAQAKPTADDEVRRLPTRGERWLTRASLAYAAVIVGVFILIQWQSDRWWPATILLFMPRGLLLLPILILAAWAGWLGRKKLWVLHGAMAVWVLIPLMGLSLPFGQLLSFRFAGPRLKIMTFNAGAAGINAFKFIKLAEREKLDIICFQEGHAEHAGKPDPDLEAYLNQGWYRNRELSIASRLPIVEELPPLDDQDLENEEAFWRARVNRVRVRAASGAEFIVATAHMPTMYYAFSDLLAGDVKSMRRHIAWRAEKMGLAAASLSDTQDLPLLVGGDFNMPSDSTFMSVLRMPGLRYAFDAAGWGFGYTRPTSFPWVRIDHIMGTPEFTFTRCWVGPDLGSDHLPLLAEVVLPKAPAKSRPDAVPAAPAKPEAAPPPLETAP